MGAPAHLFPLVRILQAATLSATALIWAVRENLNQELISILLDKSLPVEGRVSRIFFQVIFFFRGHGSVCSQKDFLRGDRRATPEGSSPTRLLLMSVLKEGCDPTKTSQGSATSQSRHRISHEFQEEFGNGFFPDAFLIFVAYATCSALG